MFDRLHIELSIRMSDDTEWELGRFDYVRRELFTDLEITLWDFTFQVQFK